MTQYLQNGLKDFKKFLHTYSLGYKDVLRQFWFQSEKIDVFSNFFHVLKVHQNLNLKPLCPPPPWATTSFMDGP